MNDFKSNEELIAALSMNPELAELLLTNVDTERALDIMDKVNPGTRDRVERKARYAMQLASELRDEPLFSIWTGKLASALRLSSLAPHPVLSSSDAPPSTSWVIELKDESTPIASSDFDRPQSIMLTSILDKECAGTARYLVAALYTSASNRPASKDELFLRLECQDGRFGAAALSRAAPSGEIKAELALPCDPDAITVYIEGTA